MDLPPSPVYTPGTPEPSIAPGTPPTPEEMTFPTFPNQWVDVPHWVVENFKHTLPREISPTSINSWLNVLYPGPGRSVLDLALNPPTIPDLILAIGKATVLEDMDPYLEFMIILTFLGIILTDPGPVTYNQYLEHRNDS